MESGNSLLESFIIIIGSATLVTTVFHSLRIPPIVGFLITGLLIGPHALGWISSTPQVENLTEVAAVLLMFTIGLEFSLRRLFHLKTQLFGFGGGQMILTTLVLGVLCHVFLHFPWAKSFFVGSLMALSSSGMVIKLLMDKREMESPYGQSSLGILLFQDMAVIPILIVLPLLASTTSIDFQMDLPTLGRFLAKGLGIVAFVIIGARVAIPKLLDRVVRTNSREVFFFCVLSICIGTAYFIHELGLSLSLGAFFAGIMISESPYGKQATIEFTPLRDNFLGLFFISVGMLVNHGFVFEHLHTILILALIIFVVKILIIKGVIWSFGRPASLGLITGLILFQMGEFSFILVEQGLSQGLLSPDERQYFLSLCILSLGLTPLLFKLAPKIGMNTSYYDIIPKDIQKWAQQVRGQIIKTPKNTQGSKEEKLLSGHTLIIGYGVAGKTVADALKTLDLSYKVIEMNNQTVNQYTKKGVPIVFGDASSLEILEKVGLLSAKQVVVTVNGAQITENIIGAIYQLRPDIPVIVRTMYMRELETLHLGEHMQPVVGEFETTLEILARTLKGYGVNDIQLQKFVAEARKDLVDTSHNLQGSLQDFIKIPGWDPLSTLHPFTLTGEAFAVGKSISELDVRKATGASVVSIYRKNLGTHLATPDFVFMENDIVYVIGSDESFLRTEQLFNSGVSERRNQPTSE